VNKKTAMAREFNLFNEDSLVNYLNGEYREMQSTIRNLSDDEAIELYKEKEGYVAQTAKKHQVNKVVIKWTKEEGAEAEPFSKRALNAREEGTTRTYIRYKFPLSGNEHLLHLNSGKAYQQSFNLLASIQPQPKMVSFEIDTQFHNNLELPENKQREVNAQALERRNFMMEYVNGINSEIDKYNSGLSDETAKFYEERYNKAMTLQSAKKKSNPF
jgi:hypothetical protein